MPNYPTCKICGNPFIPRNAQQLLCGAESCRRKNHMINDKARKALMRRTCQECGGLIPERTGRGRPHILCPECRERKQVHEDKYAGQVECLRCGKQFMSVDKRANRLCQECKEAIRRIDCWEPREVWG